MSTILKALRRLERERTRADRPLREQVTGPGSVDRSEDPPPRRWPVLAGGVAAGVAAGLALLFLVLDRGDPAREAPPQAASAAAALPPASPVPEAPVRPPPARVVEAPAPRAAPTRAPSAIAEVEEEGSLQPFEEVAVLDRGQPPPRIAAEARPEPPAEPVPPPPGSVRPFEHAKPPAARARPTAPAARPEPARPGPAPAPRVQEPEAPAPVKRPVAAPAAKASAPAALSGLRVVRTAWHPVAERRTAVVALPTGGEQSVREGDLVAGALVKRIEPSGVVFEQAGRELRRQIGE